MNAFPMVLSLWGHGHTHHAARVLNGRGVGLYETMCGEVGKANNSFAVVDCDACQRALREPSLPDLARRLLAGDAPSEAEVYAAFLRAAGAVS